MEKRLSRIRMIALSLSLVLGFQWPLTSLSLAAGPQGLTQDEVAQLMENDTHLVNRSVTFNAQGQPQVIEGDGNNTGLHYKATFDWGTNNPTQIARVAIDFEVAGYEMGSYCHVAATSKNQTFIQYRGNNYRGDRFTAVADESQVNGSLVTLTGTPALSPSSLTRRTNSSFREKRSSTCLWWVKRRK